MTTGLRIAGITTIASLAAAFWLHAQDQTTFHVKVDMVVLGFSVTDQKGKYVNGLKPKDFKVYEDDIPQKLATFMEGNHAPLQVMDNGDTRPLHVETVAARADGAPPDPNQVNLRADTMGTNVFVLFDTSNYMYR